MDKKKRYKDFMKKMEETYNIKQQKYGDSFGATYEMFGITSAASRITDKYNRFIQLAKGEEETEDESIIDTLLDMANYCIMTAVEIQLQRGGQWIVDNPEQVASAVQKLTGVNWHPRVWADCCKEYEDSNSQGFERYEWTAITDEETLIVERDVYILLKKENGRWCVRMEEL